MTWTAMLRNRQVNKNAKQALRVVKRHADHHDPNNLFHSKFHHKANDMRVALIYALRNNLMTEAKGLLPKAAMDWAMGIMTEENGTSNEPENLDRLGSLLDVEQARSLLDRFPKLPLQTTRALVEKCDLEQRVPLAGQCESSKTRL